MRNRRTYEECIEAAATIAAAASIRIAREANEREQLLAA